MLVDIARSKNENLQDLEVLTLLYNSGSQHRMQLGELANELGITSGALTSRITTSKASTTFAVNRTFAIGGRPSSLLPARRGTGGRGSPTAHFRRYRTCSASHARRRVTTVRFGPGDWRRLSKEDKYQSSSSSPSLRSSSRTSAASLLPASARQRQLVLVTLLPRQLHKLVHGVAEPDAAAAQLVHVAALARKLHELRDSVPVAGIGPLLQLLIFVVDHLLEFLPHGFSSGARYRVTTHEVLSYA